MEEKIKAAFAKKGFADKLAKCETPEEAQKLFASEGIKMSLEEVKSLGAILEKKFTGGEISDDDLNAVAGGGAIYDTYKIIDESTGGDISSTARRGWEETKRFFRRW